MGEWVGEGSGTPGQGEGYFSFQYDLDQKIVTRTSHTEFPASPIRPAFVHTDLMVVYNNNGKAIYFDNEGHLINYSVEITPNSIVLLSDVTPEIPAFRLTYCMVDKDKVNSKFEMSKDGKSFFTYIEGKSMRKR